VKPESDEVAKCQVEREIVQVGISLDSVIGILIDSKM